MDDIRNSMRDMGRQFGEQMRSEAMDRAKRRKAEYLGARVPASLKARVIAKAEALDIPVSDLIRNTLEQAFGQTETNPAGAPTTSPTPPDHGTEVNRHAGIIGCERITLNQATTCTTCKAPLQPGQEVTFGMALSGSDHAILCRKCRPDSFR